MEENHVGRTMRRQKGLIRHALIRYGSLPRNYRHLIISAGSLPGEADRKAYKNSE